MRARLEAERRALLDRVVALRRTHEAVVVDAEADPADDEHDPDGSGGVAYEREQVTALLRAAEGQLAEVDAALARVEAGTYGTCETCGGPIGDARLDALPTTRRCVSCAA